MFDQRGADYGNGYSGKNPLQNGRTAWASIKKKIIIERVSQKSLKVRAFGLNIIQSLQKLRMY